MAGLYIHVPFCIRKCRYCDFYSMPMRDTAGRSCPNAQQLPAIFLSALELELAALPEGFCADTVFVGGGTPTSLSIAELEQLLGCIGCSVELENVKEWTCEANPGTLDHDKVRVMRDAGVDRISLGVQTFDPQTLKFLGRIHTPTEARDSFALLRDAGFENINIDLIYGIPVASREILQRDLAQIVALDPEHVACYALIFEDGTELTQLRDAGELDEIEDDEQLEQYRLVRATLGDAGFGHYEISNLAKPGLECIHNLLYWSGGEYIGCGPSAHSHWRGKRYSNMRDVSMYGRALMNGKSPRDSEEELEAEAKARETLVMSLRQLKGVSRAAFQAQTGFDYRQLRGPEIDWLQEIGLVTEKDDKLCLTEKGLFVSDAVFAELV